MPKPLRPATQQGRYRSNPLSISSNISDIPIIPILPAQDYYPNIATTMQSAMASQGIGMQAYSTGGPVQHPNQHHYMPHILPLTQPLATRVSSGAWTPSDDQTLQEARAQGMNWQPIQATYFPNKTPNACRKRHERLMERRNTNDLDPYKTELMAKEYMNMRKEIWSGLAARIGEKPSVVEAKCMSLGLKNLQSHSRACGRRERLESGLETNGAYGGAGGPVRENDSGIGIEDLEAEYSPDAGSYDSSPERGYGGGENHLHQHHQRHVSDGRSSYGGERMAGADPRYMQHSMQGNGMIMQQRPQYGMQQRLPSIDGMGIGAIINRNPGV